MRPMPRAAKRAVIRLQPERGILSRDPTLAANHKGGKAMNGKFIFASILVASSAVVFAQQASRGRATPMLYQCVVTPTDDGGTARRQQVNELMANDGVSERRAATGAVTTGWDRIDLEFAITQPSRGQTVPTVSGHAIQTKGTGASGRMPALARPGSAATVTCASGVPASGERVPPRRWTKANTDDSLSRWSCSVSGTLERPQFTIGIWTGTMPSNARRKHVGNVKYEELGRAEWSFGASNSGSMSQRMSIMRRGEAPEPTPGVTCSSETAALRGAWSIATDQIARPD